MVIAILCSRELIQNGGIAKLSTPAKYGIDSTAVLFIVEELICTCIYMYVFDFGN